jgi:hypothetical protein
LTPCRNDGKVYTRSREGRGDEEDTVAEEPKDNGQFGDGGTRRIPAEKIQKAKEKPKTETTETDKK